MGNLIRVACVLRTVLERRFPFFYFFFFFFPLKSEPDSDGCVLPKLVSTSAGMCSKCMDNGRVSLNVISERDSTISERDPTISERDPTIIRAFATKSSNRGYQL